MMGVRIEADIRSDLFSHMQELSFGFYDKNRTGHLMSRVTNDLFEITELAHHGPEDLFISCVTLVGATLIMFTMQWKLALVVCVVLPIFVVFTVVMRRRMMTASLEVKQRMAGINGELESSISGMRTAKAFANEEQEIDKFNQANDQFRHAKRGYYQAMATYQDWNLLCR
jgi:ATP-binding cassette subfamily B protein